MDWNIVAILSAIVVGFVGLGLMGAAFAVVAQRGGWRQAMQSGPRGRWNLPRRLMFAGAFLCMVFCVAVLLLFAIPGGIPWITDGSGWTYTVAVLPAIAAVWYCIIRPAYAARHHQTEGGER
jgi:hypothetical protein